MRVLQQIRRAAAVGALAELIVFAPLFLISTLKISYIPLVPVPVPTLVITLEELHWPSLPLIESLYRTHWLARFVARFPGSTWIVRGAAGWLVALVQATTFALAAFVIMYIYGLREKRVPGRAPVPRPVAL